MSSFVKFTALSGSRNERELCYLLEIDDCLILLDCGWTAAFDERAPHLAHLKRIAGRIDAVLLSHADIDHIGAYVYAWARLGLCCPAFATIPVHNLGSLALAEAVDSFNRPLDSLFTHADIDSAFDRITQLR